MMILHHIMHNRKTQHRIYMMIRASYIYICEWWWQIWFASFYIYLSYLYLY